MSEIAIEARRKELLAKVMAANPSDIETVELLAEVEEFMSTLGVYPSPQREAESNGSAYADAIGGGFDHR